MKAISKKIKSCNSKYGFWGYMGYIALCAILLGLCGIWGIIYNTNHNTNQQAVSLMAQYTKLRAKPYVTLQEDKKIFNQVNRAGSDTDNIIKKMDGTTAVDNKNGHEYLVNVTPSRNRFSNAQYQLVAKANGKNAVINKAWLKEHRKE